MLKVDKNTSPNAFLARNSYTRVPFCLRKMFSDIDSAAHVDRVVGLPNHFPYLKVRFTL